MKAKARVLMITTLFVMILLSLTSYAKVKQGGSISGAINWAKKQAADPKVGYHQKYRLQQKANVDGVEGVTYYDCSSFCYYALHDGGGFDTENATKEAFGYVYPAATTSMKDYLTKLGFKQYDVSKGVKAGDVLVSDPHAMLAISDSKGDKVRVAHASGRNGIALENQVCEADKSISYMTGAGYVVWRYEGADTGGGGDSTPYATKMKESMKKEIDSAKYKYVSDTTIVTITEVTTGKSNFWLTHVIVSSPNQIVFGDVEEQTKEQYKATEKSGSQVKGCSVVNSHDYLDKVQGIVAVNGGNFDVSRNTHLPDTTSHGAGHAKVIIRNGEVYEDDGNANGREICLHKDGSLSCAYDNETADNLIKKGVKDIFASGEIRMICNTYRPGVKEGGTYGDFSDRYQDQEKDDGASGHNGYNNTILAMVEPGNYYLLSPGPGEGKTYWGDVRKYCWDLGCTFVKSLDSGGSTSLAFRENNKGNAKVIDASDGRSVPSFVYFREFKEGDPLLGGGTTPSGDDKDGGSAADDANANANGSGEKGDKWLDEDDPRLLLQEDVKKLSDNQKDVELIDRTDLDKEDLASIDKNSKDMKIESESRVIFAVRTGVALVGLIMFLYGVLVLLAYLFDMANLYTRGSLLGLITFGLAYHDESNDNDKEKRHTRKQVIIIVTVFIIVGSLLVTGTVYKVAYNMITWANNKFFS